MPYGPLPVVNSNLYPFVVIIHNPENSDLGEFCSSSELLNLRMVLGSPKLISVIRSESGFEDL